MANNFVEAIQVRADYYPAGGTESAGQQVDSINIFASINSIPYVEIGLQPGTEKTQVFELSEGLQITQMEALQRFSFSDREGLASVTIELKGDHTNQIAYFTGMPVAPSKSAGFGFVDQKIKIFGRAIYMNAFRPFVYASMLTEARNPQGEAEVGSRSPNIVRRMYDLIKTRSDYFVNTTHACHFNSRATYAMAQEIHDKNKTVLPELDTLASNSEESLYESFEALNALDETEGNGIHRTINNHILNSLLTSSGNFFQAFTSFLTSFQMYYVPDVTGSTFGKVRPFRSMLDNKDLKKVVIDTEYMSLTSEDYDYGPVQQILVQGIFQTDIARTEQQSQQAAALVPELQANTIIVYPEKVRVINGNFRPVGPPVWLPSSLTIFKEYKDLSSSVDDEGGWVITDYIKERTKVNESIDRILRDQYMNILREYARNIFLQSSLSSFTAVVRVPLDFSWEVGVRYEIMGPDDKVLYKGFLTELTHTLSGIRNNLSAWTTLVFSHVEYGSFKLDE